MSITGLMVWSRRPAGNGMSNPPEKPKPKPIKVFIEATPKATTSHRTLLYAGNRLYHRGDLAGAKTVYRHLLTELPGNKVVKFNLDLVAQSEK